MSVRVLYSFPHKIGESRICNTAWQLVDGAAAAGIEFLVCPGVLFRPFTTSVVVSPTLAYGRIRIPYKLLGSLRAFALHDHIVSRRLERWAAQVDVVHTWPLAALRTLRTARRLGIPSVLERPNAHTKFAYEVVQKECERLGLEMPPDHEHAYNAQRLAIEEEEYRLADHLLCPSEFVKHTFLDAGFSEEKLSRHQYGFDDRIYHSKPNTTSATNGLKMLFVGGVAPRKGLHYALEAWLKSSAHRNGTFSIAGAFIPGYAEKLASMLAHPSIRRLGHRSDVADLMRDSDVLILPSIEEGSALVTSEARGSGCVLIVSDAAGAICEHMKNGLMHAAGDVETISRHITLLDENRDLLKRLRDESLRTVHEITWAAAGVRLARVYEQAIRAKRHGCPEIGALV